MQWKRFIKAYLSTSANVTSRQISFHARYECVWCACWLSFCAKITWRNETTSWLLAALTNKSETTKKYILTKELRNCVVFGIPTPVPREYMVYQLSRLRLASIGTELRRCNRKHAPLQLRQSELSFDHVHCAGVKHQAANEISTQSTDSTDKIFLKVNFHRWWQKLPIMWMIRSLPSLQWRYMHTRLHTQLPIEK